MAIATMASAGKNVQGRKMSRKESEVENADGGENLW